MEQSLQYSQAQPERLQHALLQADLNEPEEVFYKKSLRLGSLIGFLITNGIVLFLAYVLTAAIGSPSAAGQYGESYTVFSWWPPSIVADVFLAFWIALFLFLCVFLWRTYRLAENYLCIYPYGLVLVQFGTFKNRTRRYFWEQIAKVWRGHTVLVEKAEPKVFLDTIRIQLNTKETLRLNRSWQKDNASRRRALCNLVEEELVKRQLPALLERYDQGQVIDMGALRISRTSLSDGDEELYWSEVESLEICEDVIRIKKVGKLLNWYYCLTPAFPNACLLRALAAQRLQTDRIDRRNDE